MGCKMHIYVLLQNKRHLKILKFMLKYRLWLIILTLTTSSLLFAQSYPKVPADYQQYHHELDLRVRTTTSSCAEWKYMIYDGKVTSMKYKDLVTKYDHSGRINEIEKVDKKGMNTSIKVFKYDKKGLPQLETEFMPTGELLGKTIYTYDSAGYLKDITWYNSNEYIISKTEFVVDSAAGTVTERKLFSPDSVNEKTIYFYSDLKNGHVVKKQQYKGENHLDQTIVYHYGDENKIEKAQFINPQGKTTSYREYHYDTKGMLQETVRLYPNGDMIKEFDFNYSDSGLLTGKLEYDQKGGMVNYCKYTYNNTPLKSY